MIILKLLECFGYISEIECPSFITYKIYRRKLKEHSLLFHLAEILVQKRYEKILSEILIFSLWLK